MSVNRFTALLRGALCAGLASSPLLAADAASADSGAGNFWALVVGMMFMIFGGMAFCYGLVRLAEKSVQLFKATRVMPVSVPPIRHTA